MPLRDILDDLAAYLENQRDEGRAWVEVSEESLKAISARPVPRAAAPKRAAVRASQPLDDTASRELKAIAGVVAVCTQCPLHKGRTRTVPGQGNPHPEILFVGEGPGAEEDASGLAFVGPAGQLLTRMIEAMGLTREDVFIANVVKCRPPNNRQPLPEEMAACLPYLRKQIAILKPKVIVTLGATALKGLLNVTEGITRMRGKWANFEGIDVMPTYHPSYLLRSPSFKKDAWEDLKAVLKRLGGEPPHKNRGE